jgi:phage-related protein
MFQVLFYETASGSEVILDFLRALPAEDRKVIGEDLKTVQIGYPMGLPLCRPMGSGLMEVRSSLPSRREARLLFTFDSATQSLVILHAFIKKSTKTPKPDLDLARRRKNEFHLTGD